ncbi:hypothetical protein DPMN_120246 [Dreissena polymorpha]|uniref:Uncharacterized protein n=1 Tax=Dreissena polymorpha TaxID=45954 RepID=A0A9D4JND3_DREPO|nr:hypothetical protein DPMN_120246 [Dreissena polymorpha]
MGPILNYHELLVKAPSPRFVTEADKVLISTTQEVAAEKELGSLPDWLAEVTPVVTTPSESVAMYSNSPSTRVTEPYRPEAPELTFYSMPEVPAITRFTTFPHTSRIFTPKSSPIRP